MRTPAVIASSAAGITYGANFTNIGAVAERVESGYGVAPATVGLFTTVLVAVHAVTQIPGGRLVDRIGARTLTLASIVMGPRSARASSAASATARPLCRLRSCRN